jgi:hypothetical protein
MKKPRSWAEALLHPGISSIDDERPWMEKDPIDRTWPDPPFFCQLHEGWSWNGLHNFGFSGLRELQQEVDYILNEEGDDV